MGHTKVTVCPHSQNDEPFSHWGGGELIERDYQKTEKGTGGDIHLSLAYHIFLQNVFIAGTSTQGLSPSLQSFYAWQGFICQKFKHRPAAG